MTYNLNPKRVKPQTVIKNKHVTAIKNIQVDTDVILPKLIDLLYGVVWSGEPDELCCLINEEVMCTHVNGVGTPLSDEGVELSDAHMNEQTGEQLYLLANNLIQLGINLLNEVQPYPEG